MIHWTEETLTLDRLHDLRSPRDVECSYIDSIFDTPIYSLAVQGRERLVAGRGRHNLLTFWDLRVPGGRSYHYTGDISPISYHKYMGNDSDCAVYLTHRGSTQARNMPEARSLRDSPVYSISLPSAFSPFLYAGVENRIVQLNFTSVSDLHPDPTFDVPKLRESLPGQSNQGVIAQAKVRNYWDPHHMALNLAMYRRGNLYVQTPVQQTHQKSSINTIDARWRQN
jgi:hypothetical protein